MAAPSIEDLKARMEAVKNAHMLAKPQAAEVALVDFLHYLASLESRLQAVEEVAHSHLWPCDFEQQQGDKNGNSSEEETHS